MDGAAAGKERLERLTRNNRQMAKELSDVKRTPVSQSAKALLSYCSKQTDPLVDRVPDRDNKFAKPQKGACTIL
eukprot:m.70083 g.70083  ORF g.70083 m.70083 type:complete len:74 (+) comp14035_c0_seq3:290-511(+)